MHAAKDDPGDREYKDLSMKAGVETCLQSVIHVSVEVHALRSENYRETGHDREQPAKNHVALHMKVI